MEGILHRFLEHLDLNKDGKPDLEQINALVVKYGPFVKQALPHIEAFLKNGGIGAIKMILSPVLSKPGMRALDALEVIAADAAKV